MTIARGIFLAALLVLTVGSIGIRSAVAPLFSGLQRTAPRLPTTMANPVATASGRHARAHAVPTRTPTSPPATATATPTPTPLAVRTPTPMATPMPTHTPAPLPVPTHRVRARPIHRTPHRPRRPVHRRVLPTPTPAPTATTSPDTGTVALASYWVGSPAATGGQTISIGYVINNGTGHTVHVLLGASLMGAAGLNWAADSLADPSHDVVATVPPGVTTHVRYFTLPSRLHPGPYDVAWGLRDATSGRRDALVFGSAALRVVH